MGDPFGWPIRTDNTVDRLRPSDGKITGTFAVGSKLQFIAFDGTNLWVTNLGSNNMTKLGGSHGALVVTFQSGGSCGNRFDGRCERVEPRQPYGFRVERVGDL